MKICPKCKAQFADDFSFCLEDGSTLKDYGAFDSAATVAVTDMATFELQTPETAEQNARTAQPSGAKSAGNSKKSFLLGMLFALALSFAAAGGAMLYFHSRRTAQETPSAATTAPTRTPINSLVVRASNEGSTNLRAEILGKVKNNAGGEYFKCKLTNVGETVVRPYNVTLMFYQGDVVIGESSGSANVEYLKPQQSVPVWVPAETEKEYASVKVKEPLTTFGIDPAKQYFLELTVKNAEMRTNSSDGYEIGGILENTNYENVSTELYVFFYDEKSEIVGVASRSFFGVQRDDRVKFEVGIDKDELFGTPKSFEIFFVAE